VGIGEDEMEQDMHWRVSGVPLWLRGNRPRVHVTWAGTCLHTSRCPT